MVGAGAAVIADANEQSSTTSLVRVNCIANTRPGQTLKRLSAC
ncbi:MAG: hypothetical protein JWQ07_5236 [Ramlibacter sp.]|nr:hypothetical protein [Ramlibacter sp.]